MSREDYELSLEALGVIVRLLRLHPRCVCTARCLDRVLILVRWTDPRNGAISDPSSVVPYSIRVDPSRVSCKLHSETRHPQSLSGKYNLRVHSPT